MNRLKKGVLCTTSIMFKRRKIDNKFCLRKNLGESQKMTSQIDHNNILKNLHFYHLKNDEHIFY